MPSCRFEVDNCCNVKHVHFYLPNHEISKFKCGTLLGIKYEMEIHKKTFNHSSGVVLTFTQLHVHRNDVHL